MKAGRITWSIVALLPLCATQAGEPPTAKIMVNPVPAKVGPPYPPLVGGGPNILGNELRLDAGGVRVWVEVQFKDWDPNGDGSPGADGFKVTLDGAGLLDADTNGDGGVTDDGDQEDIAYAMVPCNSRVDCWGAFGEMLADLDCAAGTCLPVYTDMNGSRTDGWCAGEGCDCCSHASITQAGFAVAGVYFNDFRPDDGSVRWGATAVYDVPPGAKGKYTVRLDTNQTSLFNGSVPPREIPSLSETGFVINVLTGRCCFGSGTPNEGCIDGVTRAECAHEPASVVFTPEERCPPDGPECRGACCDTLHGTCRSSVPQDSCQGSHSVWTGGALCSDVECAAETGACCDHDPFTPCRGATVLSDCQGANCTWYKLQHCEEVACPPTSIPTASSWGLAVLTLLLMIGAKVAFGRSADGSCATRDG